MKFMKLGSKPDTFQSEGDNIRYVSTELATDVVVIIGDVKFYLHKFPLLSKSARLQKLINTTSSSNEVDQIQSHEDEIEITEIPGGAASFEICVKFCYGMTVTLNAYNVVAARCAAEFLEMYETVEKGNLVYKIEVFLNSSLLQSWKDSIIVLQTTRALAPYTEELKLTGRCLDSIASRASIDTLKVEWSYTYNKKKNLDNGLRKPHTVPRDWWVEDLCDLHIDLYKRAIATINARGKVSADVIGEALHAYAIRRIPGFSKSCSVQITDFAKYRALVDSIIELIPDKKRSVSSTFLTKLLRASIFLGCDQETGLKNRVGERLDEASLSDVVLYDVVLMQSLVEVFLKSMDSRNSSKEDDLTAKASVAKLVDGYLAEKSRDSDNLPLQKFLMLAEMVTSFPRQSHDGVYRAVDMFLKEHPEINKSEKKRICRLMDCRKLSADACAHAVQNERLPMRVVVQVLFFEQARANNNGSSSTGNSTPDIVPSSNTEEDTECWDTEDINVLRSELSNLRLAKSQQDQNNKGKLVKGGGLGVSRVFSKLWSGKEKSGEMMSSSGTSSPGSVNNDFKSSSSSTNKKH